jgi:glycerol-3-phosphate dehydrogenase
VGRTLVSPARASTALDQESRTDREVSSGVVADELAQVGVQIIPGLDIDQAHVGEYVGIRPGTDKRDYQIHLDYTKRWIAAAGIRSTGTCHIARTLNDIVVCVE